MRKIFLILLILFGFACFNLYALDNECLKNGFFFLNIDTIVTDTNSLVKDNIIISNTDSVNVDTLISSLDKNICETDTSFSLFKYINSDFKIDTSVLYSWLFGNENYLLKRVSVDTSLNFFHITNPVYQKSISNSFLGNVGLANISNIFFERVDDDFIFLNSYSYYLFKPQNILYYNTKRPFTNVSYKSGSEKEQILQLAHSQNINKYFNIGLNYNLISAEGHYLRQEVKNHSLALSTSFIRERYSLHANFIVNKIDVMDNGGIINDYYLTDTVLNAKEINVKLSDARTNIQEKNFSLIQQYNFGNNSRNNFISRLKGCLVYKLNYSSDYKFYVEEKLPTDTNYYQNTFNNSLTYDSVYYNKFSNTVGFKFGEKNNLALNVFYTYLKSNYYYFNIDTLFNNSKSYNIDNEFFTISLYRNELKSLSFRITGNYYYDGYNKDNYLIKYEVKKLIGNRERPTELILSGAFKNMRNDYFLDNFRSNHFKWNNKFKNKEENRIRLLYSNTSAKLRIGLNLSQINNFVYFNKEAIPKQNDANINIYSAFVDKKITLNKFNLLNKIVYQYSDNDKVMSLPMISIYESIYYENLLKFNRTHGKMLAQIGFDVYYNTKFYAPAYMPSLAQFYLQDEKQIGDYPYVDFFINIKIKRARIFFKVQHLNSDLIKREYFTVLHYPMNERSIKFGVSWSFYN
ncbi:MAG: putative porin [Bacteroidetes bacterium]|nr:putative porin [Bacteroidota bacterium]